MPSFCICQESCLIGSAYHHPMRNTSTGSSLCQTTSEVDGPPCDQSVLFGVPILDRINCGPGSMTGPLNKNTVLGTQECCALEKHSLEGG